MLGARVLGGGDGRGKTGRKAGGSRIRGRGLADGEEAGAVGGRIASDQDEASAVAQEQEGRGAEAPAQVCRQPREAGLSLGALGVGGEAEARVRCLMGRQEGDLVAGGIVVGGARDEKDGRPVAGQVRQVGAGGGQPIGVGDRIGRPAGQGGDRPPTGAPGPADQADLGEETVEGEERKGGEGESPGAERDGRAEHGGGQAEGAQQGLPQEDRSLREGLPLVDESAGGRGDP
jgi:hypothetical protein